MLDAGRDIEVSLGFCPILCWGALRTNGGGTCVRMTFIALPFVAVVKGPLFCPVNIGVGLSMATCPPTVIFPPIESFPPTAILPPNGMFPLPIGIFPPPIGIPLPKAIFPPTGMLPVIGMLPPIGNFPPIGTLPIGYWTSICGDLCTCIWGCMCQGRICWPPILGWRPRPNGCILPAGNPGRCKSGGFRPRRRPRDAPRNAPREANIEERLPLP
mmetsp:Transcript_6280/g.9642  ORF Transcript_6280/g.9642 Transcript_6280/m.9642 type:complete len:214 (+) Transcript_6280:1099-1740(+)